MKFDSLEEAGGDGVIDHDTSKQSDTLIEAPGAIANLHSVYS